MTFEQFDKFQEELFAECIKMRDTKGKEYANSISRFANFDRLAAELDLTSPQVAWVYGKKHLDSIAEAIRTKQYTGRVEPLRGRVVDAIVYLTLIAGLIDEETDGSSK